MGCFKQWGQLLFSPISQETEEGEHLKLRKRNSRAFEFLHLTLLEGESQFAFTPGDVDEKFDESFGNCELFERRVGEDKINNRGGKAHRSVTLLRLDLLAM